MRIPRFYQPDVFTVGESVSLSSTNFRHAIQVMRLAVGDLLILFNGESGEYSARLSSVDRRNARAEIISFEAINRESLLDTRLILALIKPDKMDFAIQKAVELGVTSIQPVITDRSVIRVKPARMEKKLSHWQAIIHSACEQSGRTTIPKVSLPINFTDYLQQPFERLPLLMSPRAQQDFFSLTHTAQGVDLIIGPEGGFSEEEERLLSSPSIQQVLFGSRILRAETAVVTGLTALQLIAGDGKAGIST